MTDAGFQIEIRPPDDLRDAKPVGLRVGAFIAEFGERRGRDLFESAMAGVKRVCQHEGRDLVRMQAWRGVSKTNGVEFVVVLILVNDKIWDWAERVRREG